MEDTQTASEARAFGQRLKTIGVADESVNDGRTFTMRPDDESLAADRMVESSRLPRLVGRAGRSASPELRLKEKLGEGGMGLVSLADQLSVGRDVAVKQLRVDARSGEARQSMLREGRTTGLLEHPNIIPVYTLGRDGDDEPIIVMKRVEGVAWSRLLKEPESLGRHVDYDDPLDWHIDILMQVCDAIRFAHSKGIIHRDLKPENVMIGEFGEVYVLDWGLAVGVDERHGGWLPEASNVSTPAGTPVYMAPEMASGEGARLSERTDVYLLGAILHEILTGSPPHAGKTLHQVMFAAYQSRPKRYDETVPAALARICQKAMAAAPEERYAKVEEFRHALVEFKNHREALALARQADLRLKSLRKLLVEASCSDEVSDAQVYKMFGECRFGFEHALRVDPSNEHAQSGLQAVLELMADRELSRGAYQAASLIIADFPTQAREFDERLDELRRRLESREQEFESLQKMKQDVDLSVGRDSRSMLALGLGAVFASLWVVLDLSWRFGDLQISHGLIVGHGLFLVLLLVSVFRWKRRSLFLNEANRRMMFGLLIMITGAVWYRALVWVAGLPVLTSLATEIMLYGVGSTILGFTQDRQLIRAGLPYLTGSLLGAAFPNYVMLCFAGTNLVALFGLAWLWRAEDRAGALAQVDSVEG